MPSFVGAIVADFVDKVVLSCSGVSLYSPARAGVDSEADEATEQDVAPRPTGYLPLECEGRRRVAVGLELDGVKVLA